MVAPSSVVTSSSNKKMSSSPRGSSLKKLFRRSTSRATSSGGASSSDLVVRTSPERLLLQQEEDAAAANKTTSSSSFRLSPKKGKRMFNLRGGSNHHKESSRSELNNKQQQEMHTIVLKHADYDHENSSNNNNPRIIDSSKRSTSSPRRDSLFQWQDEMEARERRHLIHQKQQLKERDGFCRRVDAYDGQVITVDGHAAYELGNYLGGGVAGVVYEGHRLRPMEDYPVRLGRSDSVGDNSISRPTVVQVPEQPVDRVISMQSFLCVPSQVEQAVVTTEEVVATENMMDRVSSVLTEEDRSVRTSRTQRCEQTENMALEATASDDRPVLIDRVDAPSRSKHYARAVMKMEQDNTGDFPSDASFTGIMEETVAIKVLNPVGFRTLSSEITNTAVVARAGEELDAEILQGLKPMEEKHVWWLVNPNSRNLRTLQRYKADSTASSSAVAAGGPRRLEIDRGSPEKGLRISLVAAYRDPKTKQLKELPLTRCIEIWGHVPFGASDEAFKEIMTAIDRINQGQPPPPIKFLHLDDSTPGRVATEGTRSTSVGSGSVSMESLKISNPMTAKRTGIYRAASTQRKTVFCDELKAYIALPAVPSKYLKWLRQRRAATKEIRNMMLIGRHRNVVHLFEVLELIQNTKSTMFLILELVRGGELFDLISSNAAKISHSDVIPSGYTESETVMRKFFRELASGVQYCHTNGIAHRDLKPENLLVHNNRHGDCTLKIADFGLSAAFGPGSRSQTDNDTVAESIIAPGGGSSVRFQRDVSEVSWSSPTSSPSPIKDRVDRLLNAGGNALAFLTCGAVEDIINCSPNMNAVDREPSPLKRMTSVVGSPHYVAPEIISQTDSKRKNKSHDDEKPEGYDGTKADVWSAGVILYAMLFRSLPFGEDLLRCPRYQSFKKWYDEVKRTCGRRSLIAAPLNPNITEADERHALGPHWFFPSRSSPESRDLIVYMLNPDPDCRPSMRLVLQHPWLLKQA